MVGLRPKQDVGNFGNGTPSDSGTLVTDGQTHQAEAFRRQYQKPLHYRHHHKSNNVTHHSEDDELTPKAVVSPTTMGFFFLLTEKKDQRTGLYQKRAVIKLNNS
jgi:hypothetical protein